VEEGRYLAKNIPGAKYLELDSDDHVIWGEHSDRLVDEIQAFLAELQPQPPTERILMTVLFLEIAVSHSKQRHDDQVRTALHLAEGKDIRSTERGYFATFQGPTRAIQCAMAIRDRLKGIDLRIRAAIHIGECEKRADGLVGPAIRLASRLVERAEESEIIASRTVRDLMAGSGFAFEERGEAKLTDVPGTWQFYSVSGPAF
jgi:class 3 adenylate cyclase